MTPYTASLPALVLALLLAGEAAEAGEAGTHYAAWQDCLNRNVRLQAALGSRVLAADAALSACRDAQAAYLAALSASPLVDDADVARVEVQLIARVKGRLLGRRAAL